MTVAFDAYTAGGASFTHTPVGTPRGVLVFVVVNAVSTDTVTGVTYGGTAMGEVALSPSLNTSTENSSVHGFFLGSSVPTGAQTVAVTITSGTARTHCYTVTAAADTEVVDTTVISAGSGASPSGTLTLSSRTSFCAQGWMSGLGNVTNVSPLTNWNSRNEIDEGNQVTGSYSYDTIGSADVTFGLNTGAFSDEHNILAAAVSEVAGSTYTLNADGATYSYTATAAGLEFGREVIAASATYAYTAQAATMNKGRTIVADGASYAYTANAASLEFNREVNADSASYAWGATAAAVEFNREVNADAASYAWSTTATGLEHGREVAADSASYAWNTQDATLIYGVSYEIGAESASYAWNADDAGLDYTPAESAAPPPTTYGGGHDDTETRVRNWWAEIEELRARNKAQEEAEQERKEEAKRLSEELAEIEREKIKSRKKAAKEAQAKEVRRLRQETKEAEREARILAIEIANTIEETRALETKIREAEAHRELLLRRRQMALALLLIAA